MVVQKAAKTVAEMVVLKGQLMVELKAAQKEMSLVERMVVLKGAQMAVELVDRLAG